MPRSFCRQRNTNFSISATCMPKFPVAVFVHARHQKLMKNMTKSLPRTHVVCEGLAQTQFQIYRVLSRSPVTFLKGFTKSHLKKKKTPPQKSPKTPKQNRKQTNKKSPTIKQPPVVVEEPATNDSVSEIWERKHQGSVEEWRQQLKSSWEWEITLTLYFRLLVSVFKKMVVKHLPLPGMWQFRFWTTPPTKARLLVWHRLGKEEDFGSPSRRHLQKWSKTL